MRHSQTLQLGELQRLLTVSQRQHLHAMITGVNHDDAPIAVNGNTTG